MENDIFALVQNPDHFDLLQSLKDILQQGIENRDLPAAKRELEKLAPSWRNLWSLLPDNNEGAAFAAASFIVAMIATGISLYTGIGTTGRETFINNSYERYYQQAPAFPDPGQKPPPELEQPREETPKFRTNPIAAGIAKIRKT